MSRRGTELLDDTTTDTIDRRPHQRAIDILEQAVAAGEPAAAALLARGYRERGQLIEAHELLAPLVAGGRTDLAGVLADVLADLDLADDAEQAYQVAIASNDGEAMNSFALFLAGQGRQAEAVVMFERAIAAGDVLAPADLARTYLRDLHDIAAAQAVAERYLSADAPTTYCALGEVYAELGRLDEAEHLLRTGIDLGAAQAHIDYARFLQHHRCDVDAAEREYRLAGDLHEPSWGYHLGAFLLEHGQDDEAAQVLELAAYWGDLDARGLLETEFEVVTDQA
ncbi:hypothetical protein AOZ06_16160 [Kibdelosporangium phytohabitans]|uniref:Tetratrico peptide repeat group 5 domain-containing protein n=1 Tax=Kibdelosporangium phytohabitans TaxID=860235 RepID=A0A0N9I222_9PSEU|nr:hypothetical protein AOZ06_16160 [Kibdelosporangium phytohabitans]